MDKNKKIRLINLLLLLMPLAVFGANGLENSYPSLPGFSPEEGTGLLVYFFNLLVYSGGVVAVVAIIYQGISIFLSKGNVAKINEAKDRIKAAFLGLTILLGAYFILMVVNPDLTKINLPILEYGEKIFSNNKEVESKDVVYKEIALGSIIEAILMPSSTTENQYFNYSQLNKKTEEKCYLYDEEGNTIDRNNDDKIDNQDMVEGMDLSICMDNLLKATIAKISWFNGNQSICNGAIANTEGPINALKKFIRTGCSCEPCVEWPDKSFSETTWPQGCKTEDMKLTCCDSEGLNCEEKDATRCDWKCKCCGGPRGDDAGCQDQPSSPFYLENVYIDHDPCTNRQQIDCARQEMNFRIYGKGLDLGLKCAGIYEYSPDIAPFIDEETNTLKIIEKTGPDGKTYKAQFLTFTGAIESSALVRINSFKSYFNNRLAELQIAKNYINADKTKNILSLAEFQNLQETSAENVVKEPLITGYDPSTYHSFVCKKYNANNVCIQGELVKLKESGYAFLPGQNYESFATQGEGQVPTTSPSSEIDNNKYTSDKYADGWPFSAKRIWNNKLGKTAIQSDLYNAGDPDTLYILSYPGTTDPNKYPASAKVGIIDNSPTNNQCTLKDSEKTDKEQIEKGTATSSIPIGQLADGMTEYVEQINLILDNTAEEIKNVIDSADQLANLPEQCKCFSGCNNTNICEPQTGPTCDEPLQICGNPPCTDCETSEQVICEFGCLDCGATQAIDSAIYYCVRDKNMPISKYWKDFIDNDFNGWGETWPFKYMASQQGCYVSNPANNYTSSYLLKNPLITIGGEHCGCEQGLSYLTKDPIDGMRDCNDLIVGNSRENIFGIICTKNDVQKILNNHEYRYFKDGLKYGQICSCTIIPGSNQCYTPETNEPLNCTINELTSEGEFTKDSDCYKLTEKSNAADCIKNAKVVTNLGGWWNIASCNGKTIRITPKYTSNVISCEEGYTNLTEEERNLIKDNYKNNFNKEIIWLNELGKGQDELTYDGLNCCEIFDDNATIYSLQSEINEFTSNVPTEFNRQCAVDFETGESLIKISRKVDLSGPIIRPEKIKDNQAYYVCPYNEIKTQQSRIYKRVGDPSWVGLEELTTDQACLDDVPGFLQRIEQWRERLWNYQNAIDLSPLDVNRFTLLDLLNVTRSRFHQCIQGYGQQYKPAAATVYLFSCEEGIDAQILGAYRIYPEFPLANSFLPETKSESQWGCYPLNSRVLTAQERKNCLENKNKKGVDGCQSILQEHNLINDFYCCSGAPQ